MRLVLIDNYDSFTFNLYQLFCEFDVDVLVFRHDKTSAAALEALAPHWIVISPGPRSPAHSGISKDVVRRFAGRVPILGVCLGMQVINEVYEGRTERAPIPVHGKRSLVHHTGDGLFAGLPSPFWVARYHSLQCRVTSPNLRETAWADDGVLMALEHKSLPVWGVQFHPESFLSQYGLEIAARFLASQKDFQEPVLLANTKEERFPRWLCAEVSAESLGKNGLRSEHPLGSLGGAHSRGLPGYAVPTSTDDG